MNTGEQKQGKKKKKKKKGEKYLKEGKKKHTLGKEEATSTKLTDVMIIIMNIKATVAQAHSVLHGAEYLTIILPCPFTYYNSQDKPRKPFTPTPQRKRVQKT